MAHKECPSYQDGLSDSMLRFRVERLGLSQARYTPTMARFIGFAAAFLLAAMFPSAAQDAAPENRIAQLSPEDIKQGKSLFQAHCALCHGIGGTGGRGPSLRVGSMGRVSDDKAL